MQTSRTAGEPAISGIAVDATRPAERPASEQPPRVDDVAASMPSSSAPVAPVSRSRKGSKPAAAAATGAAAAATGAAATAAVMDKKRARDRPRAPPSRLTVAPSPPEQPEVSFMGVEDRSQSSLSSTGRKAGLEKLGSLPRRRSNK